MSVTRGQCDTGPIPTGAKNAFIYLTVSAGPSDFLLLGAHYK